MGPPGMQWWPGGRQMANAAGARLLLGLLGALFLLPSLLPLPLPWVRCWLAATTLSMSARAEPAACHSRFSGGAGALMRGVGTGGSCLQRSRKECRQGSWEIESLQRTRKASR